MVVIDQTNLQYGLDSFRRSWASTGRKRTFLDTFERRIAQHGLYKAAAMSSVGASNQRALKVNGNGNLSVAKSQCITKLSAALEELFNKNAVSVEQFDVWEHALATEIREIHHGFGIDDYTYGNAQKWINLAIKYILWSGKIADNNDVFKNGYFPIDRIIQQIMDKESKGSGHHVSPLGSWGKCDDWESIKEYQAKAREFTDLQGWYSPIVWEISHW